MVVPFLLALWLVLPCLRLTCTARDELLFNQLVGYERTGTAMDALLEALQGDDMVLPLHPSVLRAKFRQIATGAEPGRQAGGPI